ncbi:hypothetical protein JTE90_012415 [Oedothorax gibbosus]|uniref:Uncharacterized protein n=1 Tax=Oedothorax gibbosus TaxID=931172 RepID=A0AAV6TXG1_9ARAC|nr:hypothetical protein JTE90_012415 [Oedothorax gibbosus]
MSELKEINLRIFLVCSDAVAAQIRSEEKVKRMEDKIKSLEGSVAEKSEQFERIELAIREMSSNLRTGREQTDNLIKPINENDLISESNKPKKLRDEAPVLVIDTSAESSATSYRDALVSAAPELG